MATEKKAAVKKKTTSVSKKPATKKTTATSSRTAAAPKAKAAPKKAVAKSAKPAAAKPKRTTAARAKKKPVIGLQIGESVSQSQPPSQGDIARLAYRLWEERGQGFGSPEQDWLEAENSLRSQL